MYEASDMRKGSRIHGAYQVTKYSVGLRTPSRRTLSTRSGNMAAVTAPKALPYEMPRCI